MKDLSPGVKMMNVCDVHDCVIEKDYFIELDKKRGFNEYLRDFYVRMSEEYGDEKFLTWIITGRTNVSTF